MEDGRKVSMKDSARKISKRPSEPDLCPKNDEDNQNQPPEDGGEKRTKKDSTKTESLSHSSEQQKTKRSISSESSDTPASVRAKETASVHCPGAPRILLVNQEMNAEILEPADPEVEEHRIHGFLLRTPPTSKSKVYVKSQDNTEYRGFDRFDRLSDELILRVFHQLPRHMMCTCALVCRRWARIVCDMSLWRRMDLAGRVIKPGVLKILLERGVEVLRLSRCEIMGDFTSTISGQADPRRSPLSEDRMYRIAYLDMSMSNVNSHLVEAMFKFCPRLRKLSLEYIPLTKDLLVNLGLNSPYLETLNLCMCQGVSSEGLKVIFSHCTSLSHLNLAWTNMSAQEVKSVAESLPQQLLALDFSGNRERMSNSVISDICRRCPNLEHLDISDSTEIVDSATYEITDSLKRLKTICFSRCYQMSTSAVMYLQESKSLESINVFGLMREPSLSLLEEHMKSYKLNKEPFSSVARPTPHNCSRRLIWDQPATGGSSLDPL